MPSDSYRNRLLRTIKIKKFGEPYTISYDRYFEIGIPYIVIAGESYCAECSRRDRPYISTS
jgi:hypothetical protein